MTRPNRHRIQRQIVDLAMGADVEGAVVHRELTRPFWDDAASALEHVFDSVAGPDQLLRLDRLELDLGRIESADWKMELRRKLVAELARSLAQFTVVSEAGGGNAPAHSQPPEPWQVFLFFLVHGRLPWWSTRPAAGWTDAMLDDAAGWSALAETVLSDRRARVRFVHAVSDGFLDVAIGTWSGLRHAARVLEYLTPNALHADARQRWRLEFWMIVLDWVSAGGLRSPRGGPQLMHDLLALRQVCLPERKQRGPVEPLSRDATGDRGPNPTARAGDLPDPWHEWQLSLDDAAPFERVAPEAHADTEATVRRAAARSRDAAAPPTDRTTPVDDAIYLEGAGAILLHPFLEPLFRERDLLDGREFRDTEARDRAVYLVGLLTFGRVDVAEYDLVLAKVLCGCAVEEPLEPVQLESEDVAACEALLRAVLEHWTALRSTSPAWMREQFFLREGKLKTVDSGCLLTIERRAQDVLLSRLPWGCGVVALPWLTDRIFVHWLD
jgi:hypothetical protein